MKKFLLLLLFLILIVVSGGFWFYKNSQPVSGKEAYDYFLINKGSGASQIGKKLESEGFIKSALAFKLYLQFTGQTGKLQPGEFRLTPSYSLFQTVEALFDGPVEIWVTIPEGLRREEVASKFALTLDKDSKFIDEFLVSSKGQEGYLFPDTYLFPKEASASAIVKRMVSTFNAKTSGFEPKGSGLTLAETVTVASLLERETKTDAERPMVAGIILNRLNAGMPLQIDASVQYAVGTSKNWWPILTRDDLTVNSPYNIYKFAGLPPGPIASPGLSSLKAAFSPTENDYWYYIHDTDGKIHYAKTLQEHNSNISKYLGK